MGIVFLESCCIIFVWDVFVYFVGIGDIYFVVFDDFGEVVVLLFYCVLFEWFVVLDVEKCKDYCVSDEELRCGVYVY